MRVLTRVASTFKSEIKRMTAESLVFRFLRIDDRVKVLQNYPLGMFFYNQRAIFFLFGGVFLGLLSLLELTLTSDKDTWRTTTLLIVSWLVAAIVTLALHRRFVRDLETHAATAVLYELPPVFNQYFFIDITMVLILVGVGNYLGLRVGVFLFLLFAHTVVYSAYVGGGRGLKQLLVAVSFLVLFLIFFLNSGMSVAVIEPTWFYLLLYFVPLSGMLLMTVLSVALISWLRGVQQKIVQDHLRSLGKYEAILSGGAEIYVSPKVRDRPQDEFQQFHPRLKEVLSDLCSLGDPLWYNAACLWLLQNHQDRGDLLLPGPSFRFDESRQLSNGVDATAGCLGCTDLTLFYSMKYQAGKGSVGETITRHTLDAPGAFIPLRASGIQVGVLALYGTEVGPPPQVEEKAFLRSFGSIISNAIDQWAGRYRDQARMEMDSLFKCESLKDVFPKAAKIMKQYLRASGCMVVFRADPSKPEMEIVATDGFDRTIHKSSYHAGEGLTGRCADTGEAIRIDDVSKHTQDFDLPLLRQLEKSHRRPIISWMAVPIGSRRKNYGIIKVVNRKSYYDWFTAKDQELAEELAFRLQVVIEKFLHITEVEDASAKARTNLQIATTEKGRAEAAARAAEDLASKRQEDLMTMTHQLLGPLSAVVGAITSVQQKPLPRDVEVPLENVLALVEDAIALCYGTFTTFAHVMGRKPAFGADAVDAPTELRKLCRRLQLTNARTDLDFVYQQDPGFPKLSIDRNVFTSVMYSLIHNAMKYADADSRVVLECSYERASGEAALKVKSVGEPIEPHERDFIFQRFGRGRKVRATGRHHQGVGLGLWVGRELMRAIGGDLFVELSEQHPRLSVFIVRISATSESSATG